MRAGSKKKLKLTQNNTNFNNEQIVQKQLITLSQLKTYYLQDWKLKKDSIVIIQQLSQQEEEIDHVKIRTKTKEPQIKRTLSLPIINLISSKAKSSRIQNQYKFMKDRNYFQPLIYFESPKINKQLKIFNSQEGNRNPFHSLKQHINNFKCTSYNKIKKQKIRKQLNQNKEFILRKKLGLNFHPYQRNDKEYFKKQLFSSTKTSYHLENIHKILYDNQINLNCTDQNKREIDEKSKIETDERSREQKLKLAVIQYEIQLNHLEQQISNNKNDKDDCINKIKSEQYKKNRLKKHLLSKADDQYSSLKNYLLLNSEKSQRKVIINQQTLKRINPNIKD